MTPLTKFSSKDIELARQYTEKHASVNTLCTNEIVAELCDNAQKILDENAALREQLFQIEQEQDPARRWETILAAKLDRAIRENGYEDYLEFSNSINKDIFIITIQRKFGQTPEQLRRQSDIRRLKAEDKIDNLHNDNSLMQKRLTQLDKELSVQRAINNKNWEDIKTRNDIQLAIEMVNSLIRQHNTYFYRKSLDKLTTSMRDFFHESWTRVSQWQSEALQLRKELAAVKAELHRKIIEKSRISKYRKREKNAKASQRRSLTFIKKPFSR